jgi:hypothetical protein
VGALEDVHPRSDVSRESRRIAHDDAHRLLRVEDVVEDLMSNVSGRSCDDDHGYILPYRLLDEDELHAREFGGRGDATDQLALLHQA